MVNVLADALNFFLAIWQAIPSPIRLFVEWSLVVVVVIWLWNLITSWLK